MAAEIRAVLARRGLKQGALASLLGHPELWLSRRLTGKVPMSVDDLDAMCRVLKLEPAELIATAIREGQANIHGKSVVADRPKDNRPPGRTDQRVAMAPGTRRARRIGSLNTVPLSASAT